VKKKDLKVIAEHQFNESASKDRRKKFEEAIKIVETTDEPIAIVVDLVDRFQRGYRETVKFDDLRKDGKVELHFVNNGLVIHRNSPPQDLMVWDLLVVMARGYVLQLSANVKRSIREKLQRGEYPGGDLPTGYKVVITIAEDGSISKKKVIDEERAKFVVRCFRLFITGKYSGQTLAEKLAKAGFTSKSRNGRPPKPVKAADVINILNNPFYFGNFYYRDPDTGDRVLWPKKGRAKNYPTMIEDWKLFEKAQEILEKHNSRADGYKENDPKFKGLLKCGFCDHTLTPEELSRCYKDENSERAKEAIYYHCNNGHIYHDPRWYEKKFGTDHSGVYKARKDSKREGETLIKCPQKWWKEKEIEEWVLNELSMVSYGEEVFTWFRTVLEGEYESEFEILEDQIKSARSEYVENEGIMKGLVRSMATESDVELKEAFRFEYQELKKKQQALKEEIGELEAAREVSTDSIVETLRYCTNLKDQYLSLSEEGKRDLLKIVFSKIEPQRGEFRLNKGKGKKIKADIVYFYWNEPFATLLSINVQELADQWEEGKGKNIRLTKKNQKKASLFP
jgi:DNA invertase Pin-like site-specific DNA recombinase